MEDLKETIVQNLEDSGVIDKLRAQVRNTIFRCLKLQETDVGLQRTETMHVMETEEGQLCAELIREFLEFFGLTYSLHVFIPECHLPTEERPSEFFEKQLGVQGTHDMPMLMSVVKALREGQLLNASRNNLAKEKPKPQILQDFKEARPISSNIDINSKVSEPKKLDKPALAPIKDMPNPQAKQSLQKLPLAPLDRLRESRRKRVDKDFDIPYISSDRNRIEDHVEIPEDIPMSVETDSDIDIQQEGRDLVESAGASSSLGVDASVNSLELGEYYDYVEPVRKPR
jgi:hypothetical protein